MNLLKTIKEFVYKESIPVSNMMNTDREKLEHLEKRFCYDCDKFFKNAAGKGSHMSKKHGIKTKKKPWLSVSLTNNKDNI